MGAQGGAEHGPGGARRVPRLARRLGHERLAARLLDEAAARRAGRGPEPAQAARAALLERGAHARTDARQVRLRPRLPGPRARRPRARRDPRHAARAAA